MTYQITLGWLYPELMSTYGDRGNIIVFKNRCLWRGIDVNVQNIDFKTSMKDVQRCDIIFGGGAQDRQQHIVVEDMRKIKGPILRDMFQKNIPGLFVCGAPQLLGHSYMTGDGDRLEGLGIFDMESRHFGKDKPRCIGNLVAVTDNQFKHYYKARHSERSEESRYRDPSSSTQDDKSCTYIVGFENHGGRTYLGTGVKPFAKVIKGFGNNGEDGTEGAVYNNCIATYSHGPFLPKNPHIADWIISKALEIKYRKNILLAHLDDTLEWNAHNAVLEKIL